MSDLHERLVDALETRLRERFPRILKDAPFATIASEGVDALLAVLSSEQASPEGARTMVCPECGRVASVADWLKRPICVHAWEGGTPEVWDGDDCGSEGGRKIEDSPNEDWRTPGPRTWSKMVKLAAGPVVVPDSNERSSMTPRKKPHKKENAIERIYDLIDDMAYWRERHQADGDQVGARNASLAITHLEEAALRVGPPAWFREPRPHRNADD